MRYHGGDGLAELARAAFDAVFARTPIIVHALIRDHARGIVELAASRGVLPSDIDIERARPPYAPGRSIEHISDSVVESFVQDYGRGSFHDEIYSSAISDGDFARYVIDRVAGNFLQLPLADGLRAPEEIYEEWRHRAIDPYPERSQVLQRLLNASRRLHDLPHDWILEPMERSGVSRTERERAEAERDSIIAELEKLLGEADTHEFRIRAAGFIKDRMWDKEAYVWQPDHGGSEARRWVAWRAHDLGWTAARFADFDRELPDRSRMEHRIERIGKKYQWIALHELTGRLADLAALKGSWRDEPVRYDGPWQIDIREMDPSMFVTGTPQRDRTDRPATWWSPHVVRWRRDPPEARHAWVRDAQRDVPDPVQQIAVSDATGQRWLVLDTSISRNQHVLVDGERVIHRMTWHRVTSMLVPKNDAISLIRHLSRSASERDHPMEVDLPSDAYLGEYAWHPSSLGAQDKWSLQLGRGKSITVYATVVDRWIERSGQDYSIDESFNLSIPSPVLMSGLDLRLADGRSLDYARPDGNVVFRDPSTREPGFSAAVVNRDLFLDFLRREDLEVVWTFTGNKSAHGGHPHRDGWGGELSYWGILTLVGGQPAGALQFEMKEPDARQLAAFLAAP